MIELLSVGVTGLVTPVPSLSNLFAGAVSALPGRRNSYENGNQVLHVLRL